MRRIMISVMACLLLLASVPEATRAMSYENMETAYGVFVEDSAGLLEEKEERDLLEAMKKLTAYTNAAVVTIAENPKSTKEYAKEYNQEHFGGTNAILFVIDMDNRYIMIDAIGASSKVITSSYADIITDKVYTYASRGDYYRCAFEACEQMYQLWSGQRIAQPMKYISNVLLAVVLALLINYVIARLSTRGSKASRKQIIGAISSEVRVRDTKAKFLHSTRTYSPVNASSGSSGGGGRSGGGGGGHSSGGHKF